MTKKEFDKFLVDQIHPLLEKCRGVNIEELSVRELMKRIRYRLNGVDLHCPVSIVKFKESVGIDIIFDNKRYELRLEKDET